MAARSIITVTDTAAIAATAAQRLLARIEAQSGQIAICLTGGSGPVGLFRLLGGETGDAVPWDRVHWFIGDERFVVAGDPLHNMSVARRCFLDQRAPPGHIHPIPTDAENPDAAARRYQAELQSFYGADRLDPAKPLFDLVLMGVGPDGHTASLFPNGTAVEEQTRWVVGVPNANVAPFVPRVTLTLPALASCREMLFLVGGADKRGIAKRVLAGSELPASRAASNGETVWLTDRAASPEPTDGR